MPTLINDIIATNLKPQEGPDQRDISHKTHKPTDGCRNGLDVLVDAEDEEAGAANASPTPPANSSGAVDSSSHADALLDSLRPAVAGDSGAGAPKDGGDDIDAAAPSPDECGAVDDDDDSSTPAPDPPSGWRLCAPPTSLTDAHALVTIYYDALAWIRLVHRCD